MDASCLAVDRTGGVARNLAARASRGPARRFGHSHSVAADEGRVRGPVLLAGCVMVFRKRAGIVLLHAGVALMMIGQLLTSVGAVESRMTIPEGGTVGYSDDIRAYELAVIGSFAEGHRSRHRRAGVAAGGKRGSARADRASGLAVQNPSAPMAAEFGASRTEAQRIEPGHRWFRPATMSPKRSPPATGVGEDAHQSRLLRRRTSS